MDDNSQSLSLCRSSQMFRRADSKIYTSTGNIQVLLEKQSFLQGPYLIKQEDMCLLSAFVNMHVAEGREAQEAFN